MKKQNYQRVVDLIVAKSLLENLVEKANPKVATVMGEFKRGKLKSGSGEKVTDKDQALAIALEEAGLSNKKAEKALGSKDKLIQFFIDNPNPPDSKVHQFAEDHGMNPDQLEEEIYGILSSLLSGGKSKGKKDPVDQKELDEGIRIEAEHTNDRALAEKVARDHLAEDPKYYTKLKTIEKNVMKDVRALVKAWQTKGGQWHEHDPKSGKVITVQAPKKRAPGGKTIAVHQPEKIKPGGTTHVISEGAGLSSGKHVKLTGRKHPTDRGKVEIEHENGKKEWFPKNYLRDKRVKTTVQVKPPPFNANSFRSWGRKPGKKK